MGSLKARLNALSKRLCFGQAWAGLTAYGASDALNGEAEPGTVAERFGIAFSLSCVPGRLAEPARLRAALEELPAISRARAAAGLPTLPDRTEELLEEIAAAEAKARRWREALGLADDATEAQIIETCTEAARQMGLTPPEMAEFRGWIEATSARSHLVVTH